jgi:hypothetical protein
MALRRVPAKGLVLSPQLQHLDRGLHGVTYFIDQPGPFVKVITGTKFERLHSGFVVFDRGDHDDCSLRRDTAGVLQHLQSIDLRHLDVADEYVITS